MARIPATRLNAGQSTIVVFTAQLFSFLIHVGVAITLARLLGPEDFGLFGLAFSVIGIFEFARHGGLIVPVIQREAITSEQRNTLFWFNAALGLLLALLALAAAPLIGRVFNDARLAPLIAVLGLVFLASGLSAQHIASLRREMRFTAVATCELAALLVAAAVTVWAALHGMRYWALVGFQLVREGLQSLLLIVAARWIPTWPTRHAMVAPLLRSGGIMMLFELLGYLNFKADNLIVGSRLGPVALGYYGKAYEFLLLPINQIVTPLSTVVHSSLSRRQRDPEAYRTFLARAVLLATGLGLPITAFLFANAHALIVQVLGAQWEPSVPIYRALAPAAASMTLTCSVGWIFLSLGRARRQTWWSGLTTIVTVCAFVVGTSWGAEGVAVAFSMTRIALLVPTLMFTCAGTFVTWTEILATTARPAVGSTIAMATSFLLDAIYAPDRWTLPRNALVFVATYFLYWMLMPAGRAMLSESLALVRRRSADA
ncbi:lipopolysaccharide biosynthesis protein [Gemmatimonas sp.]|uniref:lipopolysaccharide biosynthesis protein n=1 Tax=Gemmatimonas sp. TaxID=1962908 RepID=UPI00398378F6